MNSPLTGVMAERLSARIHGQGERTLVLAHGFGTDQTAWARLMPFLTRRHRVITYDMACLDNERFDPSVYPDLSAYADDLAALLDEQEVRDATFIGHSVGGMIGALASLAYPPAFAELVLLNASPRYLDEPGYRGGFSRAGLDGLYGAMKTDYQAWIVGFAPAAVGRAMPGVIREFAAGFMAMRPDIALSVARTIFESDLRSVLPALAEPITFLHTRDDIAVPHSVPAYIQGVLPHARMIGLETEGHLPHLSAPDRVIEALSRLLDPVPSVSLDV